MGNKRRGFTLFEFLVSMAVMALIGGVSVMRIGTATQKPKHEAEKIAAYFVRLTEKADRTKADFTAEISGNNIAVKWNGNTECQRLRSRYVGARLREGRAQPEDTL